MIVYLSPEQITQLHQVQLEHYGGAPGCRDRSAVEAAVARPAMTFGGEDLYADVAAKAAALLHSLVMNHPFVDGNKRVGAHSAMLFLELNSFETSVTSEEVEQITLTVARGEIEADALAIWFRQRISRAD